MKNIHILPTQKPSRLYKVNSISKLDWSTSCLQQVDGATNQNICITSDEEIKEGTIVKIPCGVGKVKELHWKYGNDNPSYIIEDLFVYKLRYGQKEGELQTNSFRHEDVKKIILTTDQDLIADGVWGIEDGFLEWFVKNPSCEFVRVGLEIWNDGNHNPIIIIPKEEPKQSVEEYTQQGLEKYAYELEPKQETTLEEAADSWLKSKTLLKSSQAPGLLIGFIEGAKSDTARDYWYEKFKNEQDKKMYSEEDMRASYNAENEGWVNFDFWFEQFKNK